MPPPAEGRIEGASDLWADRQGIEQARARRRPLEGGSLRRETRRRPVLRNRGDAIELRVGVLGWLDRDPVRVMMAAANAGIEVVVGEVRDWTPAAEFVHIDPARRDQVTGRRRWRLEDLPRDWMNSGGSQRPRSVRRSSSVRPFRPFPSFHERQSVSIVSEHGRLVQAIAWTGELAGGHPVEAVDLPRGGRLSARKDCSRPSATNRSTGSHGRCRRPRPRPVPSRGGTGGMAATAWRAEGVGVPLRELAAGLGVGFVDLREVDASSSGGSRAWESLHRILAVEGLRPDRVARRIEAILGDSGRAGAGGLGRVVARTRDSAIDVDQWTRRLSDRLRLTGDVADGAGSMGGDWGDEPASSSVSRRNPARRRRSGERRPRSGRDVEVVPVRRAGSRGSKTDSIPASSRARFAGLGSLVQTNHGGLAGDEIVEFRDVGLVRRHVGRPVDRARSCGIAAGGTGRRGG